MTEEELAKDEEENENQWRIVQYGKTTFFMRKIYKEDGKLYDYDHWDGDLAYGSTVEKLKIDCDKIAKAFERPMVRFATDKEMEEGLGGFIEIPKDELPGGKNYEGR